MSKQIVKAFVEYIHSKERTSQKSGKPYTTYNAKLQDPETGKVLEKWFQFGFEPPKNHAGREMAVGDYIQIEATPNRDAMRVTEGSLKIHPNPPPRPENPDAEQQGNRGGNGGGGKGGKGSTPVKDSEIFGQIGGYLTEDDVRRIVLTTANQSAVTVVTALLSANALKVSEAQGAQGVVKRYEQILTAIDKLTVKYFNDLASGRQLDAHEDEGTVPTAQTKATPLPDAEPSDEADDFDGDEPGDAFPDEAGDDFE